MVKLIITQLRLVFHVLFYSEVEIFFTEDDFRVGEGGSNLQVPVRVAKSLRIATRVVLEVVPLTVQQAKSISSFPLPDNIPEDNQYSPPYAGNTCTNLLQCAIGI